MERLLETSLPRLRAVAFSQRAFRRVAAANVLWLFVIVASGASVRLTSSGLGCLDWPGCSAGDFVPTNGFHSYVEFSNRIISGVAVFLALGTWLLALLTPTARTRVRWLAAAAFLGAAAEAPLGKITVDHKLNPWLVGAHFLLSLTILMFAVLVVLDAWDVRGEKVPLPVRQLAVVVALACCALLVTGALATAAGPHSGSVAVPRIGSFKPAVWLHVRATAAFGISFALLLAWLLWRKSSHVRRALVVLALLAAQMVVGEVQYRTKLPWWLVLVHVTLAAAVWAAAVTLVAVLWRPGSRRSPSRMA